MNRTLFTSFSILALVAVGCSGPNTGSSGGRIDSYSTTSSERGADAPNIAALLEFSDQAAELFAQEMTDLPEIRNAEYRQVLELGSIQNKTRTPTSDFELIQNRVRNTLSKSKLVRNSFRIVQGRARSEAELARVQGQPQDLLQEGGNTSGVRIDDPATVYVLQGDFFESRRGDRRQYYFNFQLTNLQSREIVLNEDYDLGQVIGR